MGLGGSGPGQRVEAGRGSAAAGASAGLLLQPRGPGLSVYQWDSAAETGQRRWRRGGAEKGAGPHGRGRATVWERGGGAHLPKDTCALETVCGGRALPGAMTSRLGRLLMMLCISFLSTGLVHKAGTQAVPSPSCGLLGEWLRTPTLELGGELATCREWSSALGPLLC